MGQNARPMPATVAVRDAFASCAMLQCTLIYFIDGKPLIVPPVRILPEPRYELCVWTERGEVHFSEDAALDHVLWFGEWPRKGYLGESESPWDD